MNRRVVRQLASFGAIGALSTFAYLALYNLFRVAAAPAAANALALVVTAVGNTAANRRWTFDVRGSERLASDHAAGLIAFLIALAISTAGLVMLEILAPSAGRLLELAVLLSSNVLATAARFLLLRSWFVSRRIKPLGRHAERSGQ